MNNLAVVGVKWLADKLASSTQNLRILDATWHLPSSGRNMKEEYRNCHIPDALFFDINGCVDHSSEQSHMLPPPSVFEEYIGNLGINKSTHVILYDNNAKFGVFSAQRVWWTFRIFGHEAVSILEGGLPSWIQAGHDVTSTETPSVQKETFNSTFNPKLVKSFEEIVENIQAKNFQLVDARPSGRFQGTSPEPRPDIKPGHILKSFNVPFTKIVHPDTREVVGVAELKKLFTDAGVDLDKPIVATCGSGISACSLALAAYLCGKRDVAIYDGSWSEFYNRGKLHDKVNVPDV